MTLSKIDFAEYPRQLRSRTVEPSATYELQTDRHARHFSGSRSAASNDAPFSLQDGDKVIEIVETDVADAASMANTGPVYATEPGGTLAVPTGQVFVRFKSGVRAADKIPEIERAGYKLAQLIEYAPEAVWLSHRSENIARALRKIPALENISDVENVEPQMLTPRVSKENIASGSPPNPEPTG